MQQNGELGCLAVFQAQLLCRHLATALQTGLLRNKGWSVGRVSGSDQLLLLIEDSFDVRLAVAGVVRICELDNSVPERKRCALHRRGGRIEEIPVALQNALGDQQVELVVLALDLVDLVVREALLIGRLL